MVSMYTLVFRFHNLAVQRYVSLTMVRLYWCRIMHAATLQRDIGTDRSVQRLGMYKQLQYVYVSREPATRNSYHAVRHMHKDSIPYAGIWCQGSVACASDAPGYTGRLTELKTDNRRE